MRYLLWFQHFRDGALNEKRKQFQRMSLENYYKHRKEVTIS